VTKCWPSSRKFQAEPSNQRRRIVVGLEYCVMIDGRKHWLYHASRVFCKNRSIENLLLASMKRILRTCGVKSKKMPINFNQLTKTVRKAKGVIVSKVLPKMLSWRQLVIHPLDVILFHQQRASLNRHGHRSLGKRKFLYKTQNIFAWLNYARVRWGYKRLTYLREMGWLVRPKAPRHAKSRKKG